jgi:hypothetical protein
MQYYLNYDQDGSILGCYADVIHGKLVPVYNTEPIITKIPGVDEEGNPVTEEITQEAGTVQTGTTYDLSAIPTPYAEITEAEHVDWMQNQATRRIDIETKKLVEYTPPEPAPVIVTPKVDQNVADLWEAMLTMSAELEVLKGEK